MHIKLIVVTANNKVNLSSLIVLVFATSKSRNKLCCSPTHCGMLIFMCVAQLTSTINWKYCLFMSSNLSPCIAYKQSFFIEIFTNVQRMYGVYICFKSVTSYMHIF